MAEPQARPAPNTLLDGLMSFWNLDDASATAVDLVGSRDLTLITQLPEDGGGISEWIANGGPGNRPYTQFDGWETWARVELLEVTDVTLNFWMKVDSSGTQSFQVAAALMNDAQWGPPMQACFDVSGAWCYCSYEDGFAQVYDLAFADGWHMSTLVFNWETNTFSYYLDVVLVGTAEPSANLDRFSAIALGGYLDIGFFPDVTGPNGYGIEGGVALAGLWNRPLTVPEIEQLYNAGTGLAFSEME